MKNAEGRIQYDRRRGVLYFFDKGSGECTLRIEGIPDVPAESQLDIHLYEPGCDHHHLHCGNLGLVKKGAPRDPGTICAGKIDRPSLMKGCCAGSEEKSC